MGLNLLFFLSCHFYVDTVISPGKFEEILVKMRGEGVERTRTKFFGNKKTFRVNSQMQPVGLEQGPRML